MVGANIFAMVVLLGYCTPIQKAWNPVIPGDCMSATVLDVGGRAVTGRNSSYLLAIQYLFRREGLR